MKINEVIDNIDRFNELVDDHVQMQNFSALSQLIRSPFNEYMGGAAPGTPVYRQWQLSETMVRKLYYKKTPIIINTKATRLSFSWGQRGAVASANGRERQDRIAVVVKKFLQSEMDILLNLYQYALEYPNKADPTINIEKEVILQASEYYRTIHPVEITYIGSNDYNITAENLRSRLY